MIRKVIDYPDAGFVWIDIVTPSEDELGQVAVQYGLHENLVRDCLQPDHLPKRERIGAVEFFIVRHYDADSDEDADTVQRLTRKVAVFMGEDFLITIHRMDHDFLLELMRRWAGAEPGGDMKFKITCSIIAAALATYESRINNDMAAVEEIEDALFSGSGVPHMNERVYSLKR